MLLRQMNFMNSFTAVLKNVMTVDRYSPTSHANIKLHNYFQIGDDCRTPGALNQGVKRPGREADSLP
jgi:hypothetical protein